jgi:hypothetical protein
MSFESQVREFIRREVAAEIAPLRAVIAQLQGDAAQLAVLQQLAERLGPVLGLQPVAPAPRRRGRPARAAVAAAPASSASAGRRRRGPPAVNDRPCAIIGCKRPSRTKGYCAAHYQKLRMLARTNRLPAGWKDFADPNSVEDVVLPRGRAASKALKETRAARTARAPGKSGRKPGRPRKDALKADSKDSASEQKEG